MNYTKERWVREGNKIKASGRGTIAVCPSPTNDCGVSDFIANAQLIASAPDLYEVLERLLRFVKAFGNDRCLRTYPENCDHCEIVKRGEQALLKAEVK